jgi:hypothetical protein
MQTITVAPPNSLVLVMDHTIGDIPKTMGRARISATESCVAVGCRMEQDGPTEINLGQFHEVAPLGELVFDGEISTPSKRLSICSVINEIVLSSRVVSESTGVRVFADDTREPDTIFVLFDSGA